MEKEPDQTLREYAKQIDTLYGMNEMGELTNYYERILYNDEKNVAEIEEITKLWQHLIRRVMG